MLRHALLALTVVAAVGTACGSENSSDPPTLPVDDPVATSDAPAVTEPPAPAEPVVVQALDNTFRPQVVTVAVGTPVQFDNVGRNDHDVVPVVDGEAADGPTTGPGGWGVAAADFVPGDSYRHTFDRPGTYEYVCTIHGVAGVGMIGTIVVE